MFPEIFGRAGHEDKFGGSLPMFKEEMKFSSATIKSSFDCHLFDHSHGGSLEDSNEKVVTVCRGM